MHFFSLLCMVDLRFFLFVLSQNLNSYVGDRHLRTLGTADGPSPKIMGSVFLTLAFSRKKGINSL